MRRRQAGSGLDLDRLVTVATIQSEFSRMVLVAERHRLHRSQADGAGIVRVGQAEQDQGHDQRDPESAEQNQAEDRVRAGSEKLTHV